MRCVCIDCCCTEDYIAHHTNNNNRKKKKKRNRKRRKNDRAGKDIEFGCDAALSGAAVSATPWRLAHERMTWSEIGLKGSAFYKGDYRLWCISGRISSPIRRRSERLPKLCHGENGITFDSIRNQSILLTRHQIDGLMLAEWWSNCAQDECAKNDIVRRRRR